MNTEDTEIDGGVRGLQQRWQLFSRRPAVRRAGVLGAIWTTLPIIAALLVYWGYGEHQKRMLPNKVIALAQDASARMQDALRGEVDASQGDAEVAGQLERHAIVVDQSLIKLRAMDTAPIEELAAAADEYVLTVREILRRRAADYRYRSQVSDSVGSLRAHMREDNRTGTWVSQAVHRKSRLEADFRHYRLTAAALASLLEQYGSSRARLAPFAETVQLTGDEVSAAARQRVVESLAKINQRVKRASELNAYR